MLPTTDLSSLMLKTFQITLVQTPLLLTLAFCLTAGTSTVAGPSFDVGLDYKGCKYPVNALRGQETKFILHIENTVKEMLVCNNSGNTSFYVVDGNGSTFSSAMSAADFRSPEEPEEWVEDEAVSAE